MPQFDTGTSWDQGLNQIGSILFPDPSKIAQAGLFGAQQRNAKLQGDEEQMKIQALQRLAAGRHPWGQGPAPNFSAPGPEFAPLPVPQGLGPPAAPPSSGLVAPGQGAVVGPPPQGPMTAPVQPGPPTGNVQLSGGPIQLGGNPAQAPVPPPALLDAMKPGATTKALLPLAQNPAGPLVSGTPPATSSPAPGAGAPAASNATGSDGSLPQHDPVSGGIHPSSVVLPDGGMPQSDPAQGNGSPAPALDLSGLIADAHMAGLSAEETTNLLAEQINEARQAKMIGPNTYSQMLASLGRTQQLSSETQIATQGMVSRETAREWDQGMQSILDKDTGLIRQISRKEYFAHPGQYTAVDPQTGTAIAQQNMAPTTVYKTNPDGTVNPHETEIISKWQAIQQHRRPAGDAPVIAPPAAEAEKGGKERDKALNKAVRDMYPPGKGEGMFDYPRKEDTLMSPRAKAAVNDLAQQIFDNDPALRSDQKNFVEAQKRAMRQLQDGGYLETPDAVKARRQRHPFDSFSGGKRPLVGSDPELQKTGVDPNTGEDIMKYKIDLLKDLPKAPKGAPAPKQLPSSNLGSVFSSIKTTAEAPQGQAAVAQPGAAQSGVPVPPGTKEGSVHIDPNTKVPLIVRNGVAVPLSAAEMQQYQQAVRAQGQKGAVAGAP